MAIDTPRLILRDFRPGDLGRLALLLADPEFMIGSVRGTLDRAAARRRLAGLIAGYHQNGFAKWAVIHRAERRLIGYCGLEPMAAGAARYRELGYRLDGAYRGQGLATEAARAAVADAFGRLALPRIHAFVAPDNAASIRVLEKLGMAFERDLDYAGRHWRLYRLDAPAAG